MGIKHINVDGTNYDIDLTEVYNGLDKTTAGYALDARQGKALNDAVSAKLNSSLKGVANGLAELGSDGKVPSSQLPAYVDAVQEYGSLSLFPAVGESDVVYIARDTNITYRWGGSSYIQIGSDLALGETSSTAYRGDRGKAAYNHATDANRVTTAQSTGMYKVAVTDQGHVASVTAVQKSDITSLGIPGEMPDVSGKANRDIGAVSGNFAMFDENGNPVDSGHKHSDYLTQHQTIPTGSTSQAGILQLLDSHTSSDTTKAATPKNVKEAYDLASEKVSTAQGSGNEGKILKVDSNGNLALANETTELPSVTSSDNGKILMVVSGAWAAGNIPNANGVSF